MAFGKRMTSTPGPSSSARWDFRDAARDRERSLLEPAGQDCQPPQTQEQLPRIGKVHLREDRQLLDADVELEELPERWARFYCSGAAAFTGGADAGNRGALLPDISDAS
jgi:hypothetical protein